MNMQLRSYKQTISTLLKSLVIFIVIALSCMVFGFITGVFLYVKLISPGVGDGEDAVTAFTFGVLSAFVGLLISVPVSIFLIFKLLKKPESM